MRAGKKSRYSPHPSIAHAQAVVANMKTKTGRSLEEWIAFVKSKGPKTEEGRCDWLKEEHGLGHFFLGDSDVTVEEPSAEGERVLADAPHVRAVGERRRGRQDRRASFRERSAHRRNALGLDADHIDVRAERLDRDGHSGREPTAPDRNDDEVDVGHLLQDLETERTLPRDHERVVEGHGLVHEDPVGPVKVGRFVAAEPEPHREGRERADGLGQDLRVGLVRHENLVAPLRGESRGGRPAAEPPEAPEAPGPAPCSSIVDATVDHMSICFDQASCWPGE